MSKNAKQKILSKEYLDDLHHDLKNQVASIKAFNQLIIRRSKDKEITDYSNKIEDRTESLLELMNNFFDEIRKD